MNFLVRPIASAPSRRGRKALHHLYFGRPFTGGTSHRLLILFEPNRISYASVFPFLDYAKEFRARFDVEIRCLSVEKALEAGVPQGLADPTHVIAQTWLTDPASKHNKLEYLLSRFPDETVTAYLDSFANNDVRWINVFDSIDFYFKKSIFCDPSNYIGPTYGHTNLTEYYGHLYGVQDQVTDWGVLPGHLSKLRLAPNFLTDPDLSTGILSSHGRFSLEKDIDLHARLGGTIGTGWYSEMRRHAAGLVDELDGLRVARGTGVSSRAFRTELLKSKVCFSPFGYGELCWRDIEAIASKAVLIKPDMSHLKTEPDLYRDGETYIACRWDFSDFKEKLNDVLLDDDRREYLTENAFQVARDYLENAGPVSTYSSLFAD